MTPFDSRLQSLAEEARLRPSHIWHVFCAMQEAGEAFDTVAFAAFARLEKEHIERAVVALDQAGLRPAPCTTIKRRRSVGAQSSPRSTRLPPAMQLPDEWLSFAQTTRRWPQPTVELEFQTFLDYWHAHPKGVKLDWLATWRNWVRRSHTPDGIFVPNASPEESADGVWLYQERQRLNSAPYNAEAEVEWVRRRDGLRAG